METWQTENITTNLFNLTKLIKCDSLFLAALQEHKILSDEEVAEVESKPDRFKKAKHVLEIVQMKTQGYETLLQALSQTQQTGSVDVLLKSVPSSILDDLRVNLSGRIFNVGTILTLDQMAHLWSEIRDKNDSSEFVKFLFAHTKDKTLKLDNNTIPPPLPYYIPRTLSKRLHIKPEVFRHECNDIFVIQGIGRYQLSELTNSQLTADSTDQLDEITVRFIKLVKREDWDELCAIAKSPIHMIKYEEERKCYVLEETSGDSRTISHYMEINHEDDITISEEKLLDEMIDSDGKQGICICDLPGMGKTQVLANLARRLFQDSSKIVVFIRLQYFVQMICVVSQKADNHNPEDLLCEYITGTKIGAQILQKLVQKMNIKFHIFFDGFDEISIEDVVWTKDFLKNLSTSCHFKLYVTSRPHMRHELEESLRVFAYDILPFSFQNQVDFLTTYWQNEYPEISTSKLDQYAVLCLRKCKESFSADSRDIAGIPIQCRLIADVYKKHAFRYCKSDRNTPEDNLAIFGKSFADVYTQFVDTKFSLDVSALSTEQVSISSNHSDDLRHRLRQLALQELFPEFPSARNYFEEKPLNENEYKQIMSTGLVEDVYAGEKVVQQFIHRTIAEYLVAEFIVHQLKYNVSLKNQTGKGYLGKRLYFLKPGKKRNEGGFSSFLFNTVLKTKPTSSRSRALDLVSKSGGFIQFYGIYEFTNSTLMFFFDHLLKSSTTQPIYSQIAKTLGNTPSPESMQNIITSCGKQNLVKVLVLIESVCKCNPLKYRKSISKERLCDILLEVCIASNVQFISKCVKFFREFYSFTVDDMVKICNDHGWITHLQLACQYNLFDLLEYFLTLNCSTERQGLIHSCVRYSLKDNENEIRKRQDMINLLLKTNPNLVNERNECYDHELPLLQPQINFELVKFLVDCGADIYATDQYGWSVVHPPLAIGYPPKQLINADAYHVLVHYFLDELKASDLFKLNSELDRTPLYHALRNVPSLRVDTVKLILDSTELNINDVDWSRENLLFAAVRGKQAVEILEMLIDLGADFKTRNKNGEGLLDICNSGDEFSEIVKYLKRLAKKSEK